MERQKHEEQQRKQQVDISFEGISIQLSFNYLCYSEYYSIHIHNN